MNNEQYETRCYAVTGTASTLDCLEALLRRIEWIGERSAVELVTAFVNGQKGGWLTVRVLTSWLAEDHPGETSGALLRRLEDEATTQAVYVVEIRGQ